MVPFQHVSETTASPFVQFPKGRAGRGASSCTVANWQPSTDSSPFPLDLEPLSHALPPSSICLHPSFCHCSIVFCMEGTSRKRPRYSCPNLKETWWRNSLIGATSSPRLAWQVRSRTFSTQLITSLQGTQGSRSGLISPIFFAVTLMTGAVTTEASPCAS